MTIGQNHLSSPSETCLETKVRDGPKYLPPIPPVTKDSSKRNLELRDEYLEDFTVRPLISKDPKQIQGNLVYVRTQDDLSANDDSGITSLASALESSLVPQDQDYGSSRNITQKA